MTAAIPSFLDAMGCASDPDLVDRMKSVLIPRRVLAGASLFDEGDASDELYFVITGRLEIIKRDIQSGGSHVIRRVSRGSVIGEIGLLENTARSAGVRADRSSTLATLSRAAFEQIAEEHPAFLLGVTRTVVRRLTHPAPLGSGIKSVAVAVTNPDVDPRIFSSRVLRAVETRGSVAHVTAASITAELRDRVEPDQSPNIFQAEGLLDDYESSNDRLLLEVNGANPQWTEIALQRSDRAVVVMSSDPNAAEAAQVDEFVHVASVREGQQVWAAIMRDVDAEPPKGSAQLARQLGVDRIIHLRIGVREDLDRLARLVTGTGTGLVLGGGGARGFAHLGVYKALTEAGVHIDAVAGASVGGILAAGIATGKPADEIIDVAVTRFKGVMDYTIPIVALVKGAKITKAIEAEFAGTDYEDLMLPCLCVSTNLTTSQVAVHDSGSVTRATRASLAIPGVIPPVAIDGDLHVDGGVLDNLPIGPLHDAGLVDTIIAVDLSAPTGPKARNDFGFSISGLKALRSKIRRKRLPAPAGVVMRTMIVGSMKRREDQLNAGMAHLVLRPDLRDISLLAFDDVRPSANRAYEQAKEPIATWLASMGAEGKDLDSASTDVT